MRCLSVNQPYAELIKLLLKKNETRPFKIKYRGDLLICSTVIDSKVDACLLRKEFREPMAWAMGKQDLGTEDFRYGVALCMVDLYACVPALDVVQMKAHAGEEAFGDYSAGRYVWMLRNVRPLLEPVPVRGQQRIWVINDIELQTKITHQIQRYREAHALE